MPSALIEVRREYTVEQETAIIEAVHSALCESLKVPEADRCTRLVVHQPHRFAAPSNLEQDEYYTLINIDLFKGRALVTKKRLYKTIVRNLAPLGIPADHVKIVLHEIPKASWGLRGGLPASEIELGFEVEI